uniref:Hikeshi-like domain-containing protein n=1 Tax=Fibrocapsa japonica TaxID=94617 RepID=A0A7S2V1Q5_9STRA|mmetsp:Transcript_2198/g.3260  ORF Transcript_2198/g.3260 Transcript_2198/m.3260 type:complete len:216 (+) Transcript_2198:50-697(+)|eukprot:CAMPEP_0113945836 /NCGR_PEP_ID=MMETSP1339-20121228/52235_1 /TAXON_ID=94617 /ORGANISM="Fibrocapsa japonica" /LENGTH=215 /DNA_ID=CAMNT_0000951645 /DNA_START=18 /DNA_END=665 /DNA_ORIENTATION=- /assembly_acc=CAM_ASM_000762
MFQEGMEVEAGSNPILPTAETQATFLQNGLNQQPITNDFFGLLVPGRPVQTAFRQILETKFVADILNPQEISDVCFFTLPNFVIPEGFSVILYYSPAPFDNWSVLGALSTAKPSGVFRTGWATNESLRGASHLQLGVSIESVDVMKNLNLDETGVEDRKQFAHKIALDLFQFMASFSQSSSQGGELMVIPTNILDRWMERFEQKYRVDPNFMMKK